MRKRKLGATRGEIESALDRAVVACRVLVERTPIVLCQTGAAKLRDAIVRADPAALTPGSLRAAAGEAKKTCRGGHFARNVCGRGVDRMADELRREIGIAGRGLKPRPER